MNAIKVLPTTQLPQINNNFSEENKFNPFIQFFKNIFDKFGLFKSTSNQISVVQPNQQGTLVPKTAAKIKQFTERSPQAWKIFSKNSPPDFSYTAPVVDFKGMMLSPEEKKAVQDKAMGNYKKAMKTLDYSIADASLGMLEDKETNPELLETLNKFADRYLDVYQAYAELQQEEKAPFFNADIGIAKSFGFSHKDVSEMVKPAQWYLKECNALRKSIEKSNKSDGAAIADGAIHYLSGHNFSFKSIKSLDKNSSKLIKGTKCSQKLLYKALENPQILSAVKTFCANINGNAHDGVIIKDLGKKFGQFGGSIATIEKLKQHLATYSPKQTCDLQDQRDIVVEELKSRLGEGEREPGYIEASLMLDLLEDKSENRDPITSMRHKLYFLYKSKGLANEIAASPELVDKVNQKLAKKGWQLDKGVCNYLHEQAPDAPIFKVGSYAAENTAGNLRRRVKPEKSQTQFAASEKLTWSDAEKSRSKVNAVGQKKLSRPFRFKMSPEEEMTYFKSIFDKHKVTNLSEKRGNVELQEELETAKKIHKQPWIPGKHYWGLNNSSKSNSPYIKAVEALGLPQQAGISGSTDQTLTMAGMVGITSVEEVKRLRLMYLGWMTSHDDHSVNEILTGANSFGGGYKASPDYYKQIYPEDSKFVEKVAAEQERRGCLLPDYYLSNEHARECLALHRKEKEEKQGQAVIDKLADHSLFMKAIIAPQKAEMDDPFQKKAWTPFLKKLNTPKKSAKDNGKVKYTYNPETRALEPHKKSAEPIYTGTKKTSVSLLPSHGKILPYKSSLDENVGLLFNRKGCAFKEKYIFKQDARTDDKWWRRFYTKREIQQPDFSKKLAKAVKEIESKNGKGKLKSYNHLRTSFEGLVDKVDKVAQFDKHNEILASVKKEEVEGIFVFNKKVKENVVGAEIYTKLKGIANKISLKENEGIDVPLFMIDQVRDKGLHLYSSEQQRKDLQLLRENQSGEFDSVVDYLAVKSQQDKVSVAIELRKELAKLEQNIEFVA